MSAAKVRRTEWPRWASVLTDDGWTDSLFERVVATNRIELRPGAVVR